MKKFYKLILCFFIFLAVKASAQPPQAIPYQAVARDNNGNVIANHSISVRFSIHDSIATGPVVYRERQGVMTNTLGLFTVDVGRGTVLSGVFKNIKWGKNAKFLQVELDTAGGITYTDMGTSEMLSVPYALFADSSNFAGVIYDTSLMVVNTITHDTVFIVDKWGKSKHRGKESFFGGVWVYNDSLVVVNEFGDIVFIIFPDGTSFHFGHEYFFDGVTIGDPFGAHVLITDDGHIQVVNGAGQVVFDIAPNGDSYHAGFETFAGGAAFGIAGGSYLGVGTDGSIAIYDAAGNEVFSVDADGTSHHGGVETFGDPNGAHVTIYPGGRIDVFDAAGNITTQFLSDGTSYHAGVETFAGGLAVGIPGGSYLGIGPDGHIQIVNAAGQVVFDVAPDGTSYHKGRETFAGGITVVDGLGFPTFSVNPDGTSTHYGLETFAAGVSVRNPDIPNSLAGVSLGPDGSVTVTDAAGNVIFSISSNGTSFHKGPETFGDPNGTHTVIHADGTISVVNGNGNVTTQFQPNGTSFHTGPEIFGNPTGARVIITAGGAIQVVDANNNVTSQIANNGTSYHAGQEDFPGGVTVGTLGGGYVGISSTGTISVVDANGNVTTQFQANGTSFHKGPEIYGNPTGARVVIGADGSITVYDANNNITSQVSNNGTSKHTGLETFEGGISMGFPGGSHTIINSLGDIHTTDALGNPTWDQYSSDGRSFHYGKETFFNGIEVFNSNVQVTGGGTISGNGSGVSNLNAGNITDGTIDNLHTTGTSSNVPNTLVLRDGLGNFSAGTMTGSFSGNGSGLLSLVASSISTGTLSDLRLSSNVALRNATNNFSQPQTITANLLGSALQCTNNGGGPAGIFNANAPGSPAFQATNFAGQAGLFQGNVQVNGNLNVTGAKLFKIDHPLDPANKFLNHSCVESPDMMNIYNGNSVLDETGKVSVELPDWFESLNKDFRYQLTCIGGFAPVFIEKEMEKNKFVIAGGTPGMKVSWQVTGVRHDAYAEKHPLQVEEVKPIGERGTYLFPEAFKK